MPHSDEERLIQLLRTTGNMERVQEIMGNLSRNIRDTVLDAVNQRLNESRKQDAMRLIRRHGDTADQQIRNWSSESIGKTYVKGFNHAGSQLSAVGAAAPSEELTIDLLREEPEFGVHKEAADELTQEAYLDFGEGINNTVRNAEQRLNDAKRRAITAQLREGRLSGEALEDVAEEVAERLDQQGFTALVDRGGRRWQLQNYSEMLTRTHVIRANNQAQMNTYLDYDVQIVEISSHGATDSLCQPEEGNVYTLDPDDNSGYDYLSDPPPFHPNCKHTVLPRPDLTI